MNTKKVDLSDTDRAIIDVLRSGGKALSPKEIADDGDLNHNYIRQRLPELVDRGVLDNDDGKYGLSENVDESPADGNLEKVSTSRDNNLKDQVSLPLLSVRASASSESDVWEVREQRYMSVNAQALQRDTGGDVDQMAVVPVTGNSMLPNLRPGDKVVIEKRAFEQIIEGVIYVWRGQHHGIIFKRAQWASSNRLHLVSDADGYPTIEVTLDDVSQWDCVGRVTQVLRPM